MATVGSISVTISADLAPLRKAQSEAKKIMADIDKALSASAKTVDGAFGTSFASQVGQMNASATQATANINQVAGAFQKVTPAATNAAKPVQQYNQFIKDSAQFSQQAAFQFNDLFVQLASGQSAFTAITQQGAQLSQMFAPGTGLGAAAKTLGSSFLQFLVNPLNLAVVGIASAAAIIPVLWNAVTGGESDASKASLIEFDQLVKNIGISSKDTASALDQIANKRFSQSDLSFQTAVAQRGGTEQLKRSLDSIATSAQSASNALALAEASSAAFGVGVTQSAQQNTVLVQSMADLAKQARDGEINVQALRDGLVKVYLDPQASEETRKLAERLFVATNEAFGLEGQLDATASAAKRLAASFEVALKGGRNVATLATQLEGRIDPDNIDSLVDRLKKQKDELEDVAGELGVGAIPTPDRRPTRELGFSGDGSNKKTAANKGEKDRDYLANLQSETQYLQQQLNIMGLTYDERVRATQQLQLEKSIRDAITRLGEKATPAQKAAVTEQITLQQQLNMELQQQEAIQNVLNNAYQETGGIIGSAINGAITGTKDLKSSFLDLAVAIAKAAFQAQLLESFSNGKGGLNSTGGFLSALFGGLAGARAEGGPVGMGKPYLVGEKGPEIFTPSRSGVIIPNNKMGSGSINGGRSSSGRAEEIVVRSYFDGDGNFQTAVDRIATERSTAITQQGVAEYDKAMPSRIQQINQNPSRR